MQLTNIYKILLQPEAAMSIRTPILAALALSVMAGNIQAADDIVVYSSRIDELIKPVFDKYTEKTGVKVKFITDNRFTLPIYTAEQGELYKTYNVQGIPTTYIINSKGNILQKHVGGMNKAELKALLDTAVAEQ